MAVTVYQYPQCGTCRNAVKWLQQHEIETHLVHIVNEPPSAAALRELIGKSGLDIKKFFNVSGEVYKEMKLKDRLPSMSEEDMIELLASNGKLIKRPIVTDGTRVTVGFKEDAFAEAWGE